MLQLFGPHARIPGALEQQVPVHFDQRYSGNERAAGAQNTPGFLQHARQVRDMLHHAVGENGGEDAIGECETARVHATETPVIAVSLGAQIDLARVNIHAPVHVVDQQRGEASVAAT